MPGVDDANDERGHEGPEDGARPTEDRGPPRKTEARVFIRYPSPRVGQKKRTPQAHDEARKGRRQPHHGEGQDLGAFHIDAHESGAFHVVPDKVHVGAELVAVQEEPHDNRHGDRPENWQGFDPADPPTSAWVQDGRLGTGGPPSSLAIGHNQDHPSPEELSPERRHERRDPQPDHDDAVQEPCQQAQPAGRPQTPRGGVGLLQKTTSKAAMPKAMIEGNDRSISSAMITRVNGIAIRAKYGVVDMREL